MMAYIVMMAARLIELRTEYENEWIALFALRSDREPLSQVGDGCSFRARKIPRRNYLEANKRSRHKNNWPRLHDTMLMYGDAKAYFKSQTILADSNKMPHTLITGADGEKYQTFELTGAGKQRTEKAASRGRGKKLTRASLGTNIGATTTSRWMHGTPLV